MKKILFLLLMPFVVLANPIDDQCPQFVLRGAPVSQRIDTLYLCKQNYAINYRTDTKTAEYVVEHVTQPSVTGPAKRANDFRPDQDIPKEYQSQLSDYAGHPYDRGHLSPAGDNTQTPSIMSESFYLSNMIPQVPNNNRGIWKQLETYVRTWVNEGRDIYVVSGTLYMQGATEIGKNRVGVPTHVWKVIVDKNKIQGIAFIFPNAAIPVQNLPEYATNISEIEQLTGINFMPQLTIEQHDKVEKTFLVTDWLGQL